MIKRLNTEQDLIDYTVRSLGGESHNVEITPTMWEDIIYDAQKDFHKYTDDGSVENMLVVEPAGSRDLILGDDVLAIKRAYEPKTGFSLSNVLLNTQDTIYYDMVTGSGLTGGNLGAYIITKQYVEQIHQLAKEYIWFDFNSETKQLSLGKAFNEAIVFEALFEADPTLIYNHKFMKRLVKMHALESWANLIGLKYRGTTVGNGLELNVEGMLEQANQIREELERAKEESEYGGILHVRTTR